MGSLKTALSLSLEVYCVCLGTSIVLCWFDRQHYNTVSYETSDQQLVTVMIDVSHLIKK